MILHDITGCGDYTIVPKQYVRDKRLTLTEMGLLTMLLSLPENWDLSVAGLASICGSGRTQITNALASLEERGYLKRRRIRDEKGRLGDAVIYLCNAPGQAVEEAEAAEEPEKVPEEPKKSKADKYSEEIEEVVSYLNDCTGKAYRSSTPQTKKLIAKLLSSGYTTDDIRRVIDSKTREWSGDDKWSKYLRPETLFGNKFEGYLNSAGCTPAPKKTETKTTYEDRYSIDIFGD